MVISICIRCPYDGRLCLLQGCENCEVELEAKMHMAENLQDYWKHLNSGAEG